MKTKLLALVSIAIALNTAYSQEKVTIVVAANLKSSMDSIQKTYTAKYPKDILQIAYGASGKFYEQISNGAPFDLFFSADMNYPITLQKEGFTTGKTKLYAIGRLAIWSKKIDPNSLKLKSLLDPSVKKIAIGNPKTAPYGAKAIETLKKNHLYPSVENKLVYGENIAQAAQFVAFGAAEIGIIALSDAKSPVMQKEKGKYYIIPQENHKPLTQGCVILKHGKENKVAKRFYEYISSEKAIAILKHFGYSEPKP